MFSLNTTLVLFAITVSAVRGESHTVTFVNKCKPGKGTPRLIQGTSTLSTGAAHTVNGPLIGAIAYLQNGSCGFNGEHCTMVETTLKNPTTPGSGSSTDITLIPPHKFSVTTGFKYTSGCSTGADCTSASCKTAFHVSTDTHVQVACQANNANLEITFCD